MRMGKGGIEVEQKGVQVMKTLPWHANGMRFHSVVVNRSPWKNSVQKDYTIISASSETSFFLIVILFLRLIKLGKI